MNKLLNLIRIILIIFLIVFNGYFITIWWADCLIIENSTGHYIYLFFLFYLLVISLKDILKKESINKNKTYQMITITILIMMIFILCRARFDTHFFFNNTDLISEIEVHSKVLSYNSNISDSESYMNFLEHSMYYFRQNMIYFNAMFLLLFIYRKINLHRIEKY